LNLSPGVANNDNRYFYRSPKGSFSITKPLDGQVATHANGGTIGFLAETLEQVQAFHAAGVANGGTSCEEPPGPREGPFGALYLAYLRDPSGNKICALHRPAKPA
jgi:catechol 2,3-dioxygenase-like lactoylglutathione lyase family enzyme